MPQVLHVHDVLQQLRHQLHLVVRVVLHRVVLRGRRAARATGLMMVVMMMVVAAAAELVGPESTAHRTATTAAAHQTGRQGVGALVGAAAAAGPVLPDGLELHAHVEALVETAGRALFPGRHRDGTAGASQAHVVLAVLDGSLEEALRALARWGIRLWKLICAISRDRGGKIVRFLKLEVECSLLIGNCNE